MALTRRHDSPRRYAREPLASLSEHRHYLGDEVRFAAYERALRALCGGGPTVLDLGAGTGLLGLTALRCGARKVYGVEATGLADFTAALARANGFGADRYDIISGKSTEIDLPEQVDLVVSDQLGAFAVEGSPFPILSDAALRHLSSGGRLVPSVVELWMAPVDSGGIHHHLEFWSSPRFALDVSPLRDLAAGKWVYERLRDEEFMASPARLARLGTSEARSALDLRAEFEIGRDGVVNGLAGWFRAELAPGVWISTAPGAPDRIDREGVLMPLDPMFACRQGDVLKTRFRALLGDALNVWEASREGEPVRRHSTWQSYTATPIQRPASDGLEAHEPAVD
jgi:protein arginine N-methyltransferase 1